MFSLLKPTFSLLLRPHLLTLMLLPTAERSPTDICISHSFGMSFKSRSFSAQERLTSELLRTLLRMAASRQTSWLSLHSHLLCH